MKRLIIVPALCLLFLSPFLTYAGNLQSLKSIDNYPNYAFHHLDEVGLPGRDAVKVVLDGGEVREGATGIEKLLLRGRSQAPLDDVLEVVHLEGGLAVAPETLPITEPRRDVLRIGYDDMGQEHSSRRGLWPSVVSSIRIRLSGRGRTVSI